MARQYKWGYSGERDKAVYDEGQLIHSNIQVTKCEHCGKNTIWAFGRMTYPDRGNAPLPNSDMPAEVKADYEEAARIYSRSPRGAAALLRLAIQKLMLNVGQSGRNINDDIAALVAAGLPVQIQQALDVVRVTGNNAVHPGQLDANDAELAAQLFPLLNVIVEYQISLPARISEMYGALPEGAKAAITKRDAR
jgi:hypothetical protein